MDKKNIVFIFLILVGAAIAYQMSKSKGVSVLKIGLNIDLMKTPVDPADINNLSKAIISDNIYARLISYDDGQLKPWLAESFSIDENKVTINLLKSKTSTGDLISAKDVKVSLERLMKKDTNTHAKLQRFLKFDLATGPIVILNSSTLEIYLQKSKYVKTFLRILSSSEYGIVPSLSLDSNLNIVDFKNTTGAFYLEGNRLVKNKFFKSEDDYADEVEIVNSNSSADFMQLFIDKKIDVLPTTINLNKITLETRLKGYDFNLFKTDKIKLFLTAFGPKGISEFTASERSFFLETIQQGLLQTYPTAIDTEATLNFFPTIVSSEISKETTLKTVPAKSLNFVSYTGLENAMSGINGNGKVKVTFTDDFPLEMPFEKRPESYFMMCDVAFDDDYTLYSYILNNKIIPVSESVKNNILDSVLELEDTAEKRSALNNFHSEVINKKLVGPLFRAPYTILTRKPLSSYQSKLSASTKLWQIR